MAETGGRLKFGKWGRSPFPLLAMLAALAGGCASMTPADAPERTRGQEPGPLPERQDGMSAAEKSLLIRGVNERRSGNYGAAAATLERALRIEPSQPAPWLELARVRLLEGNYVQAEQLARKARSLAAADSALANECRQVLAEALRGQGRAGDADAL